MLTHLATRSEKWEKKGRAKYPVKPRVFWPDGVGRRQGAQPLSPTERRETPSAMPRPGGPWPDLSAYARQPARGPTMLAHLVAMLAYVGLSCGLCWPSLGLCCPSLGLCWPFLKAMWPILSPMSADLEAHGDPCGARRPEKWKQQKNTVKRRIV